MIMRTNPKILDTRSFTPATMPTEVLQIDPSDTTVNTESQWTLNINPTVPLSNECYIVLFFPNDLAYNFEFVDADGIFLPRSLTGTLSTSDFSTETGFISAIHPAGDDRTYIKFFGCNDENSLGEQPYGSALVSSITTQRAVMDSGFFGLEIYKDEDCTQAIA